MIASRGVNKTSLADPEKELRRKTSTPHITSSELTSKPFIEKLSKYQNDKNKKPAQKSQKSETGILSKFSSDPTEVIKRSQEIQRKNRSQKNKKQIKFNQIKLPKLDI